ncbi:aspartate aminotransferase family protein [Salinarchaeum chitinilyticum]
MDRETATPTDEGIPGERAAEWVEAHHAHAAPSTYVYEFVWDHTAPASGPFCTDVDGNVLLDFTAHVGAAPLGYDNPAIRERLDALDLPEPAKIAGQDFYVAGGSGSPADPEFPGPTQLQDRLADRAGHYGLDTVFLSNSGAEAVENAIKICYDETGGHRAITFEGAFHGRTLGALSLNRSKHVQRRGFPDVGGVVDAPFCDDAGDDPANCDCGFFVGDGGGSRVVGDGDGTATAESVLRRKLDPKTGHLPPEEVAYIIVEPIQGEGGYRIPSDPFLEELADLADLHDIPLVVDEIQSGIGRTGEFWAVDHGPIDPDVIAAAKGLRVGATIASSDTFPETEGRLSSTWGAGDILGALQGVLTLDVIDDEDLLANATKRGEQCLDLLDDADLPGAVDARGRGLMLAVEFDGKERRDAVVRECFERGLLVLGCGHETIRLLPPLDVREREIAMGVELFAEAVQSVAGVREE